MNFFQKSIVNILLDKSVDSPASASLAETTQLAMAHTQESFAPFSLGTDPNKDNVKRTRKQIYTKWQQMASFAPIAEGLSIHVTASLGGDAITGQLVYITPSAMLRDNKDSPQAKELLEKLNSRIKPLEKMINENIVKMVTDAVSYGDAYARVWGEKQHGVLAIGCNEYTFPPLIQAYEQGGMRNVAFQALDTKGWNQTTSKFNVTEMVRLKMPRIVAVPQYDPTDGMFNAKVMQENNINDLPIFPAHIGGSFLYQIEKVYDDVMIALSCMNSQQVADAVNQMFLTIDMSGMPPAQRDAYKNGLTKMIADHEVFVKNAINGGEALWNTKFHVLPTFSEKQVLNPIGDIKGQRSGGVDIEKFMINVRLLMGGLGLDPSMVGWADMLSGGLGDGASFHTSAQIMRRSGLVRQATKQMLDDLIALDWGYAFNEVFDENELPWNVEFYSDQSASATEQLTNQQNRMNGLILKSQAMAQLKELNLGVDATARLLERDGGMDYDEAMMVAEALDRKPEEPEGMM